MSAEVSGWIKPPRQVVGFIAFLGVVLTPANAEFYQGVTANPALFRPAVSSLSVLVALIGLIGLYGAARKSSAVLRVVCSLGC